MQLLSTVVPFQLVLHERKTRAPFENHKGCGTPSRHSMGSYRSGILLPCSRLQRKLLEQSQPTSREFDVEKMELEKFSRPPAPGVSVGQSQTGFATLTGSVTYYTKPLPMGNILSNPMLALTPADYLFLIARQGCR